MRRFFVAPENITGSTAILTGSEARHVSTVLRLTIDTKVLLFNGNGSYFEAVLTKISPSRVETKIVSITPYIETDGDDTPELHLAIGLMKGKKMDLVIQKITELGVTGLHPFRSRYCVAQDPAAKRFSRWQKIALEACKQCNRPIPLVISPPKDFKELLSSPENNDHGLKLIFWEDKEGQKSLHDIFAPLKKIDSVMIIIGPEGGFNTDEVALAVGAGYEPVTMGSRVLRTETAAIAAVSIIQHELVNLS